MALGFDLNDQQEEAVNLAQDWYKGSSKQVFEVSGPAGSGKTSIVVELVQRLGINPSDVIYMAYVGKAAMALALKGNNAKTIHGSIYELTQIPVVVDGELVYKHGRLVTRMGFKKKESLPSHIKLIVVDEGSMVNDAIRADILSFGLPIIVLGDLNQLPPVFGKPAFLNHPDYILTKVERQAEDDPIIKLSQMAINKEYIPYGQYGPMCFVMPKDIPEEKLKTIMTAANTIICGRNETRDNINKYYRREIMGINIPDIPVVGDKIICRQNNWKLKIGQGIHLINGLIGYIDNMYLESYNSRTMHIDFRPEFMTDEKFMRIPMDYNHLFKPLTEAKSGGMFSAGNQFQFAYAITAHLSQGSQYDKVLIYDEPMGSSGYYSKWLYTCITRAVKGLIILR